MGFEDKSGAEEDGAELGMDTFGQPADPAEQVRPATEAEASRVRHTKGRLSKHELHGAQLAARRRELEAEGQEGE